MYVKYDLTVEDFRRFNDYVVRSVPWFLAMRLLRYGYVPAAFALVCWMLRVPLITVLPWFLASMPVGVILIYWSGRQYADQRARSVPGFLGLKTLHISPEGIHMGGELGGGELNWQGIANIANRPQDIYFMLDRRFGLIVPKRGFNSPASAQAFYEASIRFWQGAQVEGIVEGTDQDHVWPPPPQMGV